MTYSEIHGNTLHQFFSGLVEHVFYTDVGMCDPDVVSYLSDLLLHFVHNDRIYSLQDAQGRRLTEVADMVAKARVGPEHSRDERQRIVHRHVGDFTLFWTGVYPEGLARVRRSMRKDHMIDFVEQGKRSYAITGDLTPPDSDPPGRVFNRLSEHFEFCVYGLNEVRRGWEYAGRRAFDEDGRD